MNITVLSGSPKGKHSVTLQSVNYISKLYPEHTFDVFHIGQTIKTLMEDDEAFNTVMASVEASDLIIWATPVYVTLVPAQYKRFIEKIFSSGSAHLFKGKYSAVITTSISFFDNCAVDYLRAISDDLKMLFAGSYATDSYDLLSEEGQTRHSQFAAQLFEDIEAKALFGSRTLPLTDSWHVYNSGPDSAMVDTGSKKVLLLKDETYNDTNLGRMIERCVAGFKADIEVINLSDLTIKGDCLGCIQCGFDHHCVYEGQDDFIDFAKEKVAEADILILAGEVRDRWLSSTWKQFFDRSFYQNHVPALKDKQIGLLISGPLTQMTALKATLDAITEWQGAHVVDTVTDEVEDSTFIDSRIDTLVRRIASFAEHGYIRPATFVGVGGRKIFRDDVWGRHRFVFQADHAHYESNGFYDFPHDDAFSLKMSEDMIKLTADPEMRKAVRKMLKKEMVKPHIKVVEKAGAEEV
ncbi:flavodoxin [Desulfoluna limicola]|uniref:Flavodoxin n=1 Tax=Desulfoluna limicola TaxID=2810562 RepID=A0ABN6FA96_9BACT|nr:NAD(P)H-dependent oxidoreductase [Desulfoluna limicola]BCS99093.1 flavodoxin [Desulfoluna limicola]